MISAQAVFEELKNFMTVSPLEETKVYSLCETAAQEISDQLKDKSKGDQKSVIYACAMLSLYRYALTEEFSSDSFESLKAGDVTVRRSQSLVLESAEKLKDSSLRAILPLLDDISFAFEVI